MCPHTHMPLPRRIAYSAILPRTCRYSWACALGLFRWKHRSTMGSALAALSRRSRYFAGRVAEGRSNEARVTHSTPADSNLAHRPHTRLPRTRSSFSSSSGVIRRLGPFLARGSCGRQGSESLKQRWQGNSPSHAILSLRHVAQTCEISTAAGALPALVVLLVLLLLSSWLAPSSSTTDTGAGAVAAEGSCTATKPLDARPSGNFPFFFPRSCMAHRGGFGAL